MQLVWYIATSVVLFCHFSSHVEANVGVEVHAYTSPLSFKCLRAEGFNFAIVRAFEAVGKVDPNAVQNILNAKGAGFSLIDVYMVPCYHCYGVTGGQQLSATVTTLRSSGLSFGTLWIDIESVSQWGTVKNNIQFIEEVVAESAHLGVNIGILSSAESWRSLTGDSKAYVELPIWYSNYNRLPNFDDWAEVAFGGWATPNLKRFDVHTDCAAEAFSLNYYP